MFTQIWANVSTNFKFFRRNRLLLVIMIIMVAVLLLSTMPSFFYLSKTRHLYLIQRVLSQLDGYAMVISAAIGLLLITHHIRNRSLKMVFTKPCLPETWLLSAFVSTIIVAAALYLLILLITSVLFFVWDIPYQWGVVYIVMNEFLKTLITLAYISLLGVIMHPAVVVLFILFFSDNTFLFLKMILASGIKESKGLTVALLKALKFGADAIYMILPSFNPYYDEKAKVYGSLRLTDANWKYLLFTLCYAAAVTMLCYLLSTYFIKKKRLL